MLVGDGLMTVLRFDFNIYYIVCKKKHEVSDVSLIGDAPPNKEEQVLIEIIQH